MSRRSKTPFSAVFHPVFSFVIFFVLVAFVVTSTFYVFFSMVQLSEADIRRFAPIVFLNVIVLSVLFAVFDAIRRKLLVERPAREIRATLRRLMAGDFTARVSISDFSDRHNHFGEISDHINLLAEELAGVETLRTDFIANVSHELKTPMAVIQNYATLLQQPDLSDEKRLEYAKILSGTARRQAGLITNILKLNKLENQQIFPEVFSYDLGEQLCECLISFEGMWEEKELNIETDIEDHVFVTADAEMMALVWNNLFSNAVKFSDRGGTLGVGLHSEGDFVTVRISDTGCGISKEVGSRMFDKFYQGDPSHATGGNGLGLALVKRVIDITEGEISVESEVGNGSVFTVKIPREYHGKM